MKKENRLNSFVLLFLAVWPTFYSIIFFMAIGALSNQSPIDINAIYMGALLLCHVLTMGVSLAGIVLYLRNLQKNYRIVGNQKMKWGIGILFLSIVFLPLYWWRYIRD